MSPVITQCCDCAVIGAGPGGLAAALYLARFNRKVVVFDAGKPRVEWSPRNRNYPGFPDGVPGAELIERFREQAAEFKVDIRAQPVDRIERDGEYFLIHAGDLGLQARKVVLATGVSDRWPDVPNWQELAGQRVRVCPICDAFEANEKRIGIIGCSDKVAREALYLRKFSCDVVLFTHALHEETPICDSLIGRLGDEKIELRHARIERLVPREQEGVFVCLDDGTEEPIDLLFAALGVDVNNHLAVALGADTEEDGYVKSDRWQETSVSGLYAVGDLTCSINQVTVAVGQAAIAATAIHNSLLDF